MRDYLWVFILAGIASVSLLFFIVTLSRDVFLARRLKLKKSNLVLNFSFLAMSLGSLIMIIYLFMLLKEQIGLIG
ncbi:hypothetical protein ABID30_001969 [Enterococcus rotai]|uniref:DUF1146 domain-containing protein n=1 Tax=Enterococcus rotai TaxID=118060 RepID=A0A0U2X9T7_9ENTE|nr:hypothetical protein [Enterococcus rotai]ALS36832.1 hypothetical protein ATZ35_06580 [Enterococcus rotai]